MYVHEHDRLGMLSVETAVFDCICNCWFSSSRDIKGQSYQVEYYLESVEEYSEGKIHKSEPKPGNGNVNVYCVLCYSGQGEYLNQTHGVCLQWTSTQLQMFTYIWASCLENVHKKYTFTN